MLLEFNVTNYRSLRDTQVFSMAASTYFKEMDEQNTFDTDIKGLPKLLRSAVIYGPNASGKSNLLASLRFMQFMVRSSAKEIQEGEKLDVQPFLFDKSSKNNATEFEVIFIEGTVRYQYGFASNKARVVREWLIAYPEGRPQKWFEREYDETSNEDIYTFGSKFLGGRLRQEWKRATRNNALFLSVAVQFNSEQLKPVFYWFQKRLRIIPSHIFFLSPGYTASICETEEGRSKVLDFLNAADLSIADINIEKKVFSFEDLPDDMPMELKEQLRKKMKGEDALERLDCKFIHKNMETGEDVPISIEEESDGTKNLFSFAGPWLDVIGSDKVLFVDEIDSSLHPLIVHQLVRLLHNSKSNAQLVFTTHDTTILSHNVMRRDQVWFMEKDTNNASRLYSLSDFKVRKKESLENGYLQGRYGAIPFIKEFFAS